MAVVFGVIGAAAALAISGSFPGVGGDDPTPARAVQTPPADFDAGTSFGARTPAPQQQRTARRTSSREIADNDYYDQLYEQYFGEPEDEDDDDYVYIPPEDEDGGGPGTAGEPGEPGIPDDGEGGGEGGPAGPGGAGGDG